MSLSVKFMKPWQFREDVDGNVVRNIPIGWLGELPDDVAAAAIFDGVAEPVNGKITPDVQHYLDVYAQITPDMTDEQLAALMLPPPAVPEGETVDPETGEILDPPADGPPEKKKGKARAAA